MDAQTHQALKKTVKRAAEVNMVQNDNKLLQGLWKQIGYERDGVVEPIDNEKGWQPQTKISGNTFTVTIADGSTILRGVFKLDSTRTPKAIDWTDKSGSYARDKTIKAIYTLTSTDFVFCAAYEGAARPTQFTTKPGEVLRRMKRLSGEEGV